jgi:hypothetical protein
MARQICAGIAFLFVFMSPSTLWAQACGAEESVTSFGEWFYPDIQLSAAQPSQSFDSGLPDVSALKLLFSAKSTDRGWNVVVRDANYHVLATLGLKDFAPENRRWTGRFRHQRSLSI